MKRHLPALLALLALCSCGGGSSTHSDPPPGKGEGVKPVPVADVDLEAECRAAAGRWKTLQAVYKAEGGSSATLTLAVDREGRAALRVDPGVALVLDGASLWARIPKQTGGYEVARVPIGRIFASAQAISQGKPLPGRDENPRVPAGHLVADLALSADEQGRSERHAQLAVSLAETATFGWLELLHPREGFTIRADGRTAVISGPLGRIAIDRDSGALSEWILEAAGGRPGRLKAESLSMDKPLDEALFRIEGDPAPELQVRALVREYTFNLAAEVVGRDKDEARRMNRAIGFVRSYYRAAWSDAEIQRLGKLGAARRKEVEKELRASNPDLPAADIEAASANTALPTIGEEIRKEIEYDIKVFGQIAGPSDEAAAQEYQAAFVDVVQEELAQRALDAGSGK
ncbi:MAG: hypothetical protein K8T20_16100 [Planctomycetes bacterium]|nr:hypothetical protein [Planctomycetota bacterium]